MLKAAIEMHVCVCLCECGDNTVLELLHAGMLNLLVGALVDMMCCRYKWGSYRDSLSNGVDRPTTPSAPSNASVNPIYNNSTSASLIEPVHLVPGPLPTTSDT